MSTTTASSLKSATSATEAITGRRFCRKCNSHRQIDGGFSALDARRRTVWYCVGCTRIPSGQLRPATTSSIPKSAIVRPTTFKHDATAG